MASEKGLLCTITPYKAALLGPFVDMVGVASVIPLLPFFLKDIGEDEFWVGAVLSAQYTGVVVGSYFWGRLADFQGIKKVYLLVLALDIVLFFATGLVTNVFALLAVRILAGFCALMPLGTAWIAAACPLHLQMKAFSWLVCALVIGYMCGSSIGGTMGQLESGIGVGTGGWFSASALSACLVIVVFLIIWLGTASPKKSTHKEKPQPKGVMKATLTVEFFASCISGFLTFNEVGVLNTMLVLILTAPRDRGYEYSRGQVSLVFFAGSGSILASLFFWSDWLGKRTVPEQRIVLLQMVIILFFIGLIILVITFDTTSYWVHGDVLFILIIILYYPQNCVMGPTSMNIASSGACRISENADGTIMGIHQMWSNAGQAVGPLIGSMLYKINPILPFIYVTTSEVLVFFLNLYVFCKKQRLKEIKQSLFTISVLPNTPLPSTLASAVENLPEETIPTSVAPPPVETSPSTDKQEYHQPMQSQPLAEVIPALLCGVVCGAKKQKKQEK